MNNDKQKESSLQIQLVDNIDDSEIKRKYLLTLQDLQKDIKDIKKQLQRFTQKTKKQSINLKNTKKQLKNFRQRTKKQIIHSKHVLQKQSSSSSSKEVEPIKPIEPDIQEEKFINLIERITYQNWNINIIITIQDSFKLQTIALIDSGAQINCIQEELIPTKFFEKTEQKLSTANGESLRVKFKISDVHICNGGIYIKQSFILAKDNLGIGIILGQPFLEIIKPFKVTNEGIITKLFQQKILFTFKEKPITKDVNLLKTLSIFKEHSINLIKDLSNKKFEQQLPASQIKEKINRLRNNNFCSDLLDAFWHTKRHMVSLPYEKDFTEQMSHPFPTITNILPRTDMTSHMTTSFRKSTYGFI
ncbi:RVP domain-containing protein [Cephalotus follicularis]|uniref:RVP domain-containing protein n=1 Tax=Cephalotus follicularis TaxID=3775 RepID=A0A1Q3DCV3_CEPFO|nr:RVP domain-containing protein [Cephalotus follicularis]